MAIALIPARGNSKRIPGKNIRSFHGQPIIAYSIKAALQSGCFSRVIVSTDSKDIAQVAENFGAEVPFMRPSAIADDYSATMEVVKHAYEWLRAETGKSPRTVCCIYATAPFVRGTDLLASKSIFDKSKAEFIFAATEFSFPIQRGFTLDPDGCVQMVSPELEKTRSQDLPQAYHDAGQFYWCRNSAIEQDLPIFASHSRPYLMSRNRVQDIDTFEDWDFAEKLFQVSEFG